MNHPEDQNQTQLLPGAGPQKSKEPATVALVPSSSSDPESSTPAAATAARPDDLTLPLGPRSDHLAGTTIDHVANPGGTVDLPSISAAAQGATIERPPADPAPLGRTLAPGERTDQDAESIGFSLGPQEAEAGPAAPVPTVAGYEILRELGRGGMGVVYLARQAKLKRKVALKMLLGGAHAGTQQMARFFIEAEAVAQLQHPAIVQIYEVGEHDGLPFFSLEFVSGGSLADKIAGVPQPVREAAGTVEVLALAMAYAHQHGIIHRDLKPANVLLTAKGLPKITDFGLAKRLEGDSSQTKSGTLMGTPHYMAPEQARGDTHEIGPLADVYALGVILYELLTGRTPFLGASILDTLHQVQDQEPVPPSRLQPTVPRDLETICLKCLQKEPQKRYSGAAALAEDLNRFLSGLPIYARPVGRVERVWRWCRRNPRVAALTSAVLVLLAAAVVFLVVISRSIAREREAIAETRQNVEERLQQATLAIQSGDVLRAQDLLKWSDPLLESAELADAREHLDAFRGQVAVYTDFKQFLDQARYFSLFGARGEMQKAHQQCAELIQLYDQIEEGSGKGCHGLPPLSAEQRQLFQEDVFEAFLMTAQVEWEVALRTGNDAAQKTAARQAITWLDRADKLLPSVRVLYQRRSGFWRKLGNLKEAEEDDRRAGQVKVQTTIDRFWYGYDEHHAGDAARQKDLNKAQEHYRKAMASYAALLRLRPAHFWAYFDWAGCHYQLGNRHDAIVGFTACIQIRRDVPWPYYNRGNLHLELEEYDQAIQDYSAALERDAGYVEAYHNRAKAYFMLKQYDRAIQDYNAALERNDRYLEAYYNRGQVFKVQGQTSRALEDFDRALQVDPKYTKAYLEKGDLYLASGDLAQARVNFSQAIKLQPEEPTTYWKRGLTHLLAKEFDGALPDLKEFARLQPTNPDPPYYIAIINKSRRRYNEALDALEQAIKIKPGYAKAYLGRAQIFHQLGKYPQALVDLNVALANPEANKADALADRADLYRTMGRLEEAAADYRQAIKLAPKEIDVYVGLALVCQAQKKPDLAKECYDRMVAADPGSAAAYLRRAEFYRDRGQFEQALADCDQADRHDPKSAVAGLVRASIAAARGNHGRAVADAEQALKNAPDNGPALYAAACVWSLASRAAADANNSGSKLHSQRYADRAAALLDEAWAKGVFELSYQQFNRMADDPALAPILYHPGVQKLLPRML